MNKQNTTYTVAIALLVLGFNFALFSQVKTGKGLPIAITCLALLLALIIFRNRTPRLTQRGRTASIALVGVVLTAASNIAGLAFAVIGLLALMLVQFRIMARGNNKWFLVGGDPLHKLDEIELAWTSTGLAMMASTVLTFIFKVAWLTHTA